MVSPNGFKPDLETASDNAFQQAVDEDAEKGLERSARLEFDRVVSLLRTRGIEVTVFEGKAELPDSVFPNNWFSTEADGSLVLYPMSTIGRRLERRPEIVEWLEARYPQLTDLSPYEDRGQFLEGTGSLVLDHENRIAFAARSNRTSESLVANWCADFEYEPVVFKTFGPRGLPVYHTNVLLTIGTGYAVVCTECIENPVPVLSSLLATDRELIEITRTQMASFCGNALELESDGRFLIMSSAARSAFTSRQLKSLESYVRIESTDIPTIERFGGGGVRCMLAELF